MSRDAHLERFRSIGLPGLVTLGLIQAIWPLTMDLYLPAFPAIARSLVTSPSGVQLTLTAAFVGMAAGQLIAGPVSDAVGRMRPLVVVLVGYVAMTALCAVAPSIELLVSGRFLQGLAASSASVISLAIVRDIREGAAMATLIARLQLVNGVFVVGSPAIGALLLHVVDWRGLFAVLVGCGVVLAALALLTLARHETVPREGRHAPGPRSIAASQRTVLSDRRFVVLLVAGATLWGAMMSYMASSAFVFQGVYHLSPTEYAIVFGGHGGLMIAGAQFGARLARRGIDRLLRRGLVAASAVAIVLLLSVALAPGFGLVGFIVPLLGFVVLFGIVQPVLQSAALLGHPDRAGAAASLLGASNMVVGAVVSPLVGLLGVASPVPAIAVMAVLASAAAVTLLAGRRVVGGQAEPGPPR
jgi:MFS transporter, DHA1 family, multidrug resistance protein